MRSRLLAAVTLVFVGSAWAQPGLTTIEMEAWDASRDGNWIVGQCRSPTLPINEPCRWSAGTGIEALWPSDGSGYANAASADGSVVTGVWNNSVFRWSEATGRQVIEGITDARDISADGTVLVGKIDQSPFGNVGFVWTEATGIVEVPGFARTLLRGISGDGTFAVGDVRDPVLSRSRVLLWEWETSPPVMVGPPVGHEDDELIGLGVSANGRVVFGDIWPAPAAGNSFLWTAEDGYRFLPNPPCPSPPCAEDCRVFAVADDASLAVGLCVLFETPLAVVWVGAGLGEPFEAYLLRDFLTMRGIEVGAEDYFFSALAISGDGRVIVGNAYIDERHVAYRVEFCYANCDQSSTPPYLGVDDFTCFIDRFAEAKPLPHKEQIYHYANCDGSTTAPVLTVDDFICFIDEFARGCSTP